MNAALVATCLLLWLCRLERNKDREESVSSMEYLKNVVLKVHMYACQSVHLYICVCVYVCVCACKHQVIED